MDDTNTAGLVERLLARTMRVLDAGWQKGRTCPDCGGSADRPKCAFELGALCPRHDPDNYEPSPFTDVPDELCTEAADTLTAQAAEIARLKEVLNKANLPEWFYHPDYTESVLFSPDEVIDEVYDFEPGWHIAEIDCAKPLPTIWCAVHVRTCDEMDALETDDRFVFTEHASREAAEAALTGSQSHD